MATDKMLFHVDAITVDGAPVAFEDGTGVLTGAARWENTVVPTAGSGDDFASRKRVATIFKLKLQFGQGQAPTDFSTVTDARVTATDQVTGRRVMLPRCGFGSMGEIGAGSVEVTFNVLSAPQWL